MLKGIMLTIIFLVVVYGIWVHESQIIENGYTQGVTYYVR